MKAPHLDELVGAYKLIAREFGFTPRVHRLGIIMTQLDPEEDAGRGDSEAEEAEEAEEDAKMPAAEAEEVRKRRRSKAQEMEQHLQVCRTVHGAFLERAERIGGLDRDFVSPLQ